MNGVHEYGEVDDAGIAGLLDLLLPEPRFHLDTPVNIVTAIIILAENTGIVVAKWIASSAACESR